MRFRGLVPAVAVILCLTIAISGCGRKKQEPAKKGAEPAQGGVPSPKRQAPVTPTAPAPELEPLVITEEKVLFDFEKGDDGWEIPMWAQEQDDYVAQTYEISSDAAKSGKSSLKLMADFQGGSWRAALVELEQYFDWTPYKAIMADVYVPPDCPEGLRAKIILTVGENWEWTEMSTTKQLTPGEWTTITADLRPNSYDWKRTVPTDAFRQDVRKIAVRIESNKRPVYKGPIYIDVIRLGK